MVLGCEFGDDRPEVAPNRNIGQYAIVQYVKGKTSPPNEAGNNSETVKALNYASGTSWRVMGVVGFSGSQIHIAADRPFGIRVGLVGYDSAHVVVADAYDEYSKRLHIVDPWYGCSKHWYDYDLLVKGVRIQSSGNNGPKAKWTHTFVSNDVV
ncbi:MAG: hypothetical protein FWG10_01000 [Eubacteriaceae bacterium]|nr:hypothetical protein [Eubacteriaceae bacterium]